jgi:hypothetical protein
LLALRVRAKALHERFSQDAAAKGDAQGVDLARHWNMTDGEGEIGTRVIRHVWVPHIIPLIAVWALPSTSVVNGESRENTGYIAPIRIVPHITQVVHSRLLYEDRVLFGSLFYAGAGSVWGWGNGGRETVESPGLLFDLGMPDIQLHQGQLRSLECIEQDRPTQGIMQMSISFAVYINETKVV